MSQQEREALVLLWIQNPSYPIETWCKENGMSLSSHYRTRKALKEKVEELSSTGGKRIEVKGEKEAEANKEKAEAGWAFISTKQTGDAGNTKWEEPNQESDEAGKTGTTKQKAGSKFEVTFCGFTVAVPRGFKEADLLKVLKVVKQCF